MLLTLMFFCFYLSNDYDYDGFSYSANRWECDQTQLL